MKTVWAVSLAALVAVYVFHTFIAPVREVRHLGLALVAGIAFAVHAGRVAVVRSLGASAGVRTAALILLAVIAVGIVLERARPWQKPKYGATEAADVVCKPELAEKNVLVVSPDALGEGAMIAEVAMRQPRPSRSVLRSSKVLADTQWDLKNYRLLAEDAPSIMRVLNDHGVSVLALHLDPSPNAPAQHYVRLNETVRKHPNSFADSNHAGHWSVPVVRGCSVGFVTDVR